VVAAEAGGGGRTGNCVLPLLTPETSCLPRSALSTSAPAGRAATAKAEGQEERQMQVAGGPSLLPWRCSVMSANQGWPTACAGQLRLWLRP
jgi:hypothetical protein